MAFGIKVENEYLDLYPSSTLSFQFNSELWVTGDPSFTDGSFSFPIDVPLSPKNMRILRYSHRIENYDTMPVIEDVVVYVGEGMSIGMPFFSGTMYVKKSSPDKANIYIVQKGLNRKKDLKINEVDMGVYNLSAPVSLKAVMDWSTHHPLDNDFIFFSVKNTSVRDALSVGGDEVDQFGSYYNLIMNGYDSVNNDWKWVVSASTEHGKNQMIVPFLRLKPVLKRIVEALGYSMDDQWLTTEELQCICVFNNQSINDLGSNYKKTIRYNEHLPTGMTLVEFLKQVCKYSFIGLFVDHTRKVISLIPYRDVLKQPHTADWTYATTDDYDVEQDNLLPSEIGFEKDDTDAYFSKNFISNLVLLADGAYVADYWKSGGNVQSHGLIDGYYNVKRNGSVMRYNPANINTPGVWTKVTHRFGHVNVGGKGSAWLSKVVPLYDDDIGYGIYSLSTMPRADISMNIDVLDNDVVHELRSELTSIRLTIYRGWRTFPVGNGPYPDKVPYANNSAYDPANEANTFEHSLHMYGEKGIYELYGQSWVEFMKRKKIVNRRLRLTVKDIMMYREWQKVRIGNMNYFVKAMKVTATSTGLGMTECTLVSIPFS